MSRPFFNCPQMRLFFAISVPDSVAKRLAGVRRSFSRDSNLRWVAPENLHITLAFLGEQSPDDLERLTRIGGLTAQGFPCFTLVCQGFGSFKRRVLWAGLQGERLDELARRLHQRLKPAGFIKQGAPTEHHITLARRRKIGTELRLPADEQVHGSWEVRDFQLLQSVLTPRGPEYTTRGRFELGD